MATAQNNLLSTAQTRKLQNCADITGCAFRTLLAHAVSNFLSDEAPILMDRARKNTKTARKPRTSKMKQPKPFIISRTAPKTIVSDVKLDAILWDWANRENGDSEQLGSFTQPEVDKGISYLDEEFSA